MLSQEDLRQIAGKGITEAQVEAQLEEFKNGFPFLRIDAAAGIGNGIVAPADDERSKYIDAWNAYKAEGRRVVKFVPASGAASRMFKDMFAFLDGDHDEPQTDFEKKYFDNITKFAFYDELDEACKRNEGKNITALLAEGDYKAVVRNMLDAKGLNYESGREVRTVRRQVRHKVRRYVLRAEAEHRHRGSQSRQHPVPQRRRFAPVPSRRARRAHPEP